MNQKPKTGKKPKTKSKTQVRVRDMNPKKDAIGGAKVDLEYKPQRP
jgi:hypothetical protein